LFLCVIIFNTVAICMKKKLKPIDMYATVVTYMVIQTKVDRWTYMLDWYGFFSRWFVDAPTLLISVGLYPAAAVIMLNFYPSKHTGSLHSNGLVHPLPFVVHSCLPFSLKT
jgi:hypothetical protein